MRALEALGREYSVDILKTAQTPKSVGELSESLDIPIATCYRRIGQLTAVGLLEECQPQSEESQAARYRRTTDAIDVRFLPEPSVAVWPAVQRRPEIDRAASSPARSGELSTPRSPESPGLAPGKPSAGSADRAVSDEDRE
jgi:hypothetical protein